MFVFGSPAYLLLLFAVPAAVFFSLMKARRSAINLPVTDFLNGLPTGLSSKIARLVPVLKYAAMVIAIISLARPQFALRQNEIISEGVNIVMTLDISGSMSALDFKLDGKRVTRLDAVKSVVRDFISKRTGDRIALVVFASQAFTQIPLTRDYSTISYVLDKVEIGAAGLETAIGDAIGISLKRIEDVKSKSNIIILLSDGKSNAGELTPEEALQIAADKKIKIYTIGVGTNGVVPFLNKDKLSGRQYVDQARFETDEATLEKIATKTGGKYYKAENIEALASVYEEIDRLEKTKIKIKDHSEYKELYPYFVFSALLLFMIHALLSNTRFLKVP